MHLSRYWAEISQAHCILNASARYWVSYMKCIQYFLYIYSDAYRFSDGDWLDTSLECQQVGTSMSWDGNFTWQDKTSHQIRQELQHSSQQQPASFQHWPDRMCLWGIMHSSSYILQSACSSSLARAMWASLSCHCRNGQRRLSADNR